VASVAVAAVASAAAATVVLAAAATDTSAARDASATAVSGFSSCGQWFQQLRSVASAAAVNGWSNCSSCLIVALFHFRQLIYLQL
jgi:hypothetical protein